MGVFFTIFEKVKKDIFARNFFRMDPIDLKICAKKTCNRSGSSPKILSKSDNFSKIYDIFKINILLIIIKMLKVQTHLNIDTIKKILLNGGEILFMKEAYTTEIIKWIDSYEVLDKYTVLKNNNYKGVLKYVKFIKKNNIYI